MNAVKSIKLNSGYEMPMIALGTYLVKEKDVIMKIVEAALAAGYRSFDTAEVYENEAYIGEAFERYLPQFKLEREDIFITSKLATSNQGSAAAKAIKETMANLKTPYLDLFLIHFPATQGLQHSDPKNTLNRAESWKAMEAAVKEGVFRSIGVSNYTIKQLEELLKNCNIKPAVDQVEFHPYLFQKDLLEFCKKNGIALEAYSSLGSQTSQDLINDKTVAEIAKKHHKEPGHILLRWAIQHNVLIIPKSKNPERIMKNIQIFDFNIDDKDMAALDGLNQNKRYSWDPTDVV